MMSTIKEHTTDESDSNESSGDNDDASEEDVSDHSEDDAKEVEESGDIGLNKKIKDKKTTEDLKEYPLTFVCNSLSDYSAKEDGELSFEKGEMLTVISIRKDGWWIAKNIDEMQGLVPSTFLKVPDQLNKSINDLLQSKENKDGTLWSSLRRSLRKASVWNAALRSFSAGGLPIGFRDSLLGTLLKESSEYSTETFVFPKLNESGLSFEDMYWEPSPTLEGKSTMVLKPLNTVLEKVVHLVALRQIIPPPPEYVVTSRHLHMCLHDGNKVLSNIHSTRAIWDPKNPKIWMFNSKIPLNGSCLEEGDIFIRSNKSFATLGILFELCVSYKKDDAPDILEMSCGWSFMRLLNDSGIAVKSRTKIFKVYNSVPFTNNLDTSAASLNSLQKFMNQTKQPRLVIKISNPKRSSSQQIKYLPSTLIGPVSNISLISLYRKVISDCLLQRPSFDSNELIQSPFLHNFPKIFNDPDLTDLFRCAWTERQKTDKSHGGLKTESKKLAAFHNLFMESLYLILNICFLPTYCLGNRDNEKERKAKLSKVRAIVNAKERGNLALSSDLEFKPISLDSLSTYITR